MLPTNMSASMLANHPPPRYLPPPHVPSCHQSSPLHESQPYGAYWSDPATLARSPQLNVPYHPYPSPATLAHASPLVGPLEMPPPHTFSPHAHSVPQPLPLFSPSTPRKPAVRLDIVLEAPTAAAQRLEDSPLTYLNKGQFYTINLKDTEGYDGIIESTLTIMFHDESHRRVAPNYWKFWLSQQKNAKIARAIDIDPNRSQGVQNISSRYFDRVTFQWNGKAGAAISVRFNCLSTDFSRIKGVKGIPLRLHMESHMPQKPHWFEKSHCRIKLFRDKGAERKNKDDAKHIEKQLEKLRGKNGEPHPLWLAYSQNQPYTIFYEVPSSDQSTPSLIPNTTPDVHYARRQSDSNSSTGPHRIELQPAAYHHHHHHIPPNGLYLPPPLSSCTSMKRARSLPSYSHTPVSPPVTDPTGIIPPAAAVTSPSQYSMHMPPLDIDPSYIPQQRSRVAKRCIFVKLSTEPDSFYRAVYLEQLTLKDLIEQLASKMNIQKEVKGVIRQVANKEKVIVQLDDNFVQDIQEEQDMQVSQQTNDDDTVTLVLHY